MKILNMRQVIYLFIYWVCVFLWQSITSPLSLQKKNYPFFSFKIIGPQSHASNMNVGNSSKIIVFYLFSINAILQFLSDSPNSHVT